MEGRLAIIHNLNARRPQPSLDEVIDDEFVARRAMREGQFDDGLTIPFDSLYPFPRPRASTPSPKRARAGADADASFVSRQPRFFTEAIAAAIFCFELLVLIGSIAAVAGILLLVGASS